MHEIALCDGMLEQVAALCARHGARSVACITLEIGPLSGVEASQLADAFAIARCGTVADGAELMIETPPVIVWCGDCGAQSEAAVNRLACVKCGGKHVELVSGNEMILKTLQLVGSEEAGDV